MAWYFLNLFKKPFLIKRMHTIGTKNVVKKVKKVAEGKVKDKGKVWFKELRDKRMLFYTNLYRYQLFFLLFTRAQYESPFVLLHEKLW